MIIINGDGRHKTYVEREILNTKLLARSSKENSRK